MNSVVVTMDVILLISKACEVYSVAGELNITLSRGGSAQHPNRAYDSSRFEAKKERDVRTDLNCCIHDGCQSQPHDGGRRCNWKVAMRQLK